MAAHAADPGLHRPGYAAAWPPTAAQWPFGPDRSPVQLLWFQNRHPPERAPPYAPLFDDEYPPPHAYARPQSRVPVPRRVPADARAQPDSTPERSPPEYPGKSDTLKPLPEKMFRAASSQIGLSMPGQYATLGGVARDWTGWCAHCRRATAEKPALAKSQSDGKTRNCRAPRAFAWPRPIDGSPQPWDLRTPRPRFPYRSLDTRPPGKARTSGRPSAQRKHPFRRYLPRAHSAGEFFRCPGCPEYASRAIHPLRRKPPDGRAPRGGQPVLQPHAVPVCLPEASPQFTLSSSVLMTVDAFLTNNALFSQPLRRGGNPCNAPTSFRLQIRKKSNKPALQLDWTTASRMLDIAEAASPM